AFSPRQVDWSKVILDQPSVRLPSVGDPRYAANNSLFVHDGKGDLLARWDRCWRANLIFAARERVAGFAQHDVGVVHDNDSAHKIRHRHRNFGRTADTALFIRGGDRRSPRHEQPSSKSAAINCDYIALRRTP